MRRTVGCAFTVLVAAALLAGCGSGSGTSAGTGAQITPSAAGAGPTSAASAGGEPCPTTTPTVAEPQQFKAPPLTVAKTTYTMTIVIACKGTVTIAMNAAATPQTVNSFAFLAAHHWFDDTPCHRLTTPATGISVLQCGDPTGTGLDGPGYTIPDENLSKYKAGSQGYAVYPAGSVAMANTGQPHSGGSQFFLNYGPSMLAPTFTPFGTVTSGLSVLKSIAAAGIVGGQPDGPPAQPVVITSLTVTKG